MKRWATPGFTLVEMLVTVAILAIIASLSLTSYRQYLRRSYRADATTALLKIASAQERHYTQNGLYAGAAGLAAAPPAGLGMAGTAEGYYSLAIQLPAGGATAGFTATATVDPASAQADDDDCWIFSVNELGHRTAENRSGETDAEITAYCWR